MDETDLIPHLFRTEYRKIVAVLGKLFGIEHIEIAEDIVSDTFLQASELWPLKGLPDNPAAWLYVVAKNKTRDYLRHHAVFANNIYKELRYTNAVSHEMEIDLSLKNINDSQLAMMFVVCHPCNPAETQISLALNLLCGFGAGEIAGALLTGRDIIYKRLQRGKEKLRQENIKIEQPSLVNIQERLPAVLMTLYLLFNEGYYSSSHDIALQKDVCFEAIRLTHLLIEQEYSNTPATHALLSLMCFHASRFDARMNNEGNIILYHDQDTRLWNGDLLDQGEYHFNQSARGNIVSKYHLESAIARWHALYPDSKKKWEDILFLYNQLLIHEYSPVAALNRTYAVSKVHGKKQAITEAEKIQLTGNHLYHSLLGDLYTGIDNKKAITHFETAWQLTKSNADKLLIASKIQECKNERNKNNH